MIYTKAYDDHAAMTVLSNLDGQDLSEAMLVRGSPVTHLSLFADWRAMNPVRCLTWIVCRQATDTPFAVVALANTGQAGVAGAALLARNHRTFRRELVATARVIRDNLPDIAVEFGIRRIEARCWSEHPTAARFLMACGFRHEADMPGFGAAGGVVFQQFAWIIPPDMETEYVRV